MNSCRECIHCTKVAGYYICEMGIISEVETQSDSPLNGAKIFETTAMMRSPDGSCGIEGALFTPYPIASKALVKDIAYALVGFVIILFLSICIAALDKT